MRYHYEDLAHISYRAVPPILEAYRGTDIVEWYGRIEQSLVRLLHDAEGASNDTYAGRIRTFLQTWRENPIDGSLNRETVQILIAAATPWANENWDLQSFFGSLRTSLRTIIASEEELPRDLDTNQGAGMGGGRHGGGSMPPPTNMFGPEADIGSDADLEGEPGLSGSSPGDTLTGPETPDAGTDTDNEPDLEPEESPTI